MQQHSPMNRQHSHQQIFGNPVHTNKENPVLTISYTEKPKNHLKTQLIITESNSIPGDIWDSKMTFGKFRHCHLRTKKPLDS